MKIEFISRNYELGDKLKAVTEKKLSKLDKYFQDGDQAEVKITFKKESALLKTEIMLDYHGSFVRAEVASKNFYDNLDKVLPKVEGQIRKYRTRWDKNHKNTAYKDKGVFVKKDELTKQVVKDKQFKMTPMTIDQAIEEMELLGHSFYVFIDAKTQQVKVLYLRNDGQLGLIEPQI